MLGRKPPSENRLWQRALCPQTDAGQHWEGKNYSKPSLCLIASCCEGWGSWEVLSSAAAPCRAHLPVPALPQDTAAGEHPAVCSSASFSQRQPAAAFVSGYFFFSKFPQQHRASRIITGLTMMISAAPGRLPPGCTAQPCSSVPSAAWIQLLLPSHHMVSLPFPSPPSLLRRLCCGSLQGNAASIPPSALLCRRSSLFGDAGCLPGWC